MSADARGASLATVLDALTLVQGQLDRLDRSNKRIEATQRDILARLDTIDAGQAAVTDLLPTLEMILARSIEDRDLNGARFATVAQIAAFAHAAAKGSPAALPDDVADDQLLEQYALTQPADRTAADRATTEWRKAVAAAATAELVDILARQYQPSPTDTPRTRVLRYRLAAITREEIKGRGAVPPEPPASTTTADRSTSARNTRSENLARLWRAGESTALFAEPELAGALDLFAEAERRGGGAGEEALSAELAQLHRNLGDRLTAGERPSTAEDRAAGAGGLAVEIYPDRPR